MTSDDVVLDRFVIPPYGRAGFAVAATPGETRLVDCCFAGEVPERRRIVVSAPCGASQLIERYICLSCAQPCQNRFQLEEHTSPFVHHVAQWCLTCYRWEPALETVYCTPCQTPGRSVSSRSIESSRRT